MTEERDLDKLLAVIAHHCIKAIGGDRCTIFLADHDKGEIWSRLAQGSDEIRMPITAGLAGESIRNKECIIIADAYADPRFNRDIDKQTGYRTQNLIVVPLVNNCGEAVGCFEVINKRSGDFNQADIHLLQAFSAQASTAIETALLVAQKEQMIKSLLAAESELRDALNQLSVVYEIEKFASRATEMPSLAQTTLEKLLEATDVEIAGIGLRQADDELHFYGLHLTKGMTAAPFLDDNPDPSKKLREFLETAFATPVASSIQKPLILIDEAGGQEIIGSITLANKPENKFSQEDHRILDIIAGQVSSVCQRHRLLSRKTRKDRMAIVGQVAATLVHDVRNPLSTITGFGHLMAQSADIPPDEIKRFIRIINREANRANSMLEELLDLASGRRKLQIATTSISDFLLMVEDNLKLQAGNYGINLEIHNEAQGTIKVDTDRLMRVFLNIANNAFEALSKGGTFSIYAKSSTNSVQFFLSDDGPGVPQGIQNRIFRAFFTHGKSRGTGLGMYIAQDIINAHNGTLRLDKHCRSGARFEITLPR